MNEYIFQKAINEDVAEILLLIQKRINWMDENNISQWNKTNYLTYYPRNYFEKLVSKAQLYVVKYEALNRVIGAFALLEQDMLWKDSAQSYYIHHLVSDLEERGIGAVIIKFCEELALEHGKSKIRLDCQASNHKLNEYYSALGFAYVGMIQAGNYTGIKREKKINDMKE